MLLHISCTSPAKEKRAPGSIVIQILALTEITLYRGKKTNQTKKQEKNNQPPSPPQKKTKPTEINDAIMGL